MRVLVKFSQIFFSKSHISYYRKREQIVYEFWLPGPGNAVFIPFFGIMWGWREEKREGEKEKGREEGREGGRQREKKQSKRISRILRFTDKGQKS